MNSKCFMLLLLTTGHLSAMKITQQSYTEVMQNHIKEFLADQQGDCHPDEIFDSEKLNLVTRIHKRMEKNPIFSLYYKKAWGEECLNSYRNWANVLIKDYELEQGPLMFETRRETLLLLEIFLWQEGHVKKPETKFNYWNLQ